MGLKDLGKVIETDILIVGGGLGGLFAAIKAKDRDKDLNVLLVDKCEAALAGPSAHAAGIVINWQPGDNADDYIKEIIVENSEYLIDQDYVPESLPGSYERVCELLDYGVAVQREPDGNLLRIPVLSTGYGMGTPFPGGTQLTWKTRMQGEKRGARYMGRTYITDLLMDGTACAGAVGFNVRTGEFFIFRAKATILANGTVFYGRRPQMGPAGTTGDAAAAVLRAGGQFRNPDQIWATHGPAALDSSGIHVIFGSGGIIRNSEGDRIMEHYKPKLLERSRRYDVARAILMEWKEGRGPCYLDLSHLPSQRITHIKTSLPRLTMALQRWGIDMAKDKIDWVPYGLTPQFVGGVRVESGDGDVHGLRGLWAVGNASDFVGGCDSTVATQLIAAGNMGARAGAKAAEFASGTPVLAVDEGRVERFRKDLFTPLNIPTGSMGHKAAADRMSEIAHRYIGLLKDESRLKEAVSQLQDLEDKFTRLAARDAHQLMIVQGLKNKLLCEKASALASLERRESRACHYRLDYPHRDDKNWLKWMLTRLDKDGHMETFTEDIPVEKWPYRPEVD